MEKFSHIIEYSHILGKEWNHNKTAITVKHKYQHYSKIYTASISVLTDYGCPMEQGRPLYFCPVVSSSVFLSSFFPSPNLRARTVDVHHTSTHRVALVRIYDAGLKWAARSSLEIQDAKMTQKIAISAPSHKFVGLYLCNYGIYRQSVKKLVSSNTSFTCPRNMVNFSPLTAEIVQSLGHPYKFQPVSRLGSVIAWHSSSGRQPNFAALNRWRHLYSAGRPSHWAVAHILDDLGFYVPLDTQ